MIFSKFTNFLLILCLLMITQCYKAPFFELTVETIGQDLGPIGSASITIEVTDIENGNVVEGSIIYVEGITNSEGLVEFDFEKKAFISVTACFESDYSESGFLCKSGHVYLEENENKTLTLMLEEGGCLDCVR